MTTPSPQAFTMKLDIWKGCCHKLCAMLLDLRMQISVQKTSFMIPFDLSTAVIYQKISEALVRIN